MICGVDEAGKGAVFGPLVVAAVCCDDPRECARLGAKDSKKISPSRREVLFTEISIRFKTAIVCIDAPSIDRYLQVMTMNECVVRAHAAVITQLCPAIVYVDACDVNAARYGARLRALLDHDCTIIAEHKADHTYPVVGAASIIAKVVRDREVAALRQRYGALGSGYPADPVTRTFLVRYINEHGRPPPFARTSWQTVSDCLSSYSQTHFSDFK
ncbi:MAG: ribonuclease HII [Methanomicrobiales archaeon]|nr:ribonuclease HII [Methanomicrobiales archaeon]